MLEQFFAVSSSLHFTGTSNFFDNVKSTNKKQKYAHGGGATYITNNTVLNFHGATLSTTQQIMRVVQSTHHTIQQLLSVELATSSTIMYIDIVYMVLVVQFTHMTMLYLPSMEPTSSSATQQDLVVQFMQEPTPY